MKCLIYVYVLVSFLMLFFTGAEYLDNKVTSKYDFDPGFIQRVPIEASYKRAREHERFVLKVYSGYIISSIIFGCIILSKKRKAD